MSSKVSIAIAAVVILLLSAFFVIMSNDNDEKPKEEPPEVRTEIRSFSVITGLVGTNSSKEGLVNLEPFRLPANFTPSLVNLSISLPGFGVDAVLYEYEYYDDRPGVPEHFTHSIQVGKNASADHYLTDFDCSFLTNYTMTVNISFTNSSGVTEMRTFNADFHFNEGLDIDYAIIIREAVNYNSMMGSSLCVSNLRIDIMGEFIETTVP